MMADPLVILGAGHCGGRAAEALRRLGYDGRLILVGAEPDLPYERPPLSKGLLTGAMSFADCRLHDEAYYRENAVELLTEMRATAVDLAARRVELESGAPLSFGKLLVTTGATPRRLSLPGTDLPGVLTLRDRSDSEAIGAALQPGARIAVVGGGFIGLEVAASARARGCAVVVLEAAPQLLGRVLPKEVGQAIGAVHGESGVEVRLNAQTTAFLGDTRVTAVALDDGSEIAADAVVIGIGIAPETALAEAAGLAVEDGVMTDAGCATAAEGVCAAGDVARTLNPRYGRAIRLESWQNAEQQAEVAAKTLLGETVAHAPVPWVWSDQYDWNLQVAGFPGEGDSIAVRGSLEDGKALFFALKDGALIGAVGLGHGTAAAKDLRVAQMMIERGARPDAAQLADPDVSLKQLVKAA